MSNTDLMTTSWVNPAAREGIGSSCFLLDTCCVTQSSLFGNKGNTKSTLKSHCHLRKYSIFCHSIWYHSMSITSNECKIQMVWFGLIVFNATINNISVISWRSVLLVEETEVHRETTDLSKVTDKLYDIMLYTSPWVRFELTTSVVIVQNTDGTRTFVLFYRHASIIF